MSFYLFIEELNFQKAKKLGFLVVGQMTNRDVIPILVGGLP